MRSSMTGSSVWNLHRIPSISMASCIRFVCQIHGKETTVICSFYFCAVPKRLEPPRRGGMWKAKWQVGTAFVYGRQQTIRWKEVICLWRVLGWEVPVKVIVASVEGYKDRFTLVTSAVELTGLQMVELFTARFRQEDGFRDLKQRLGWEECRAWTANPIERTSQAQWVTLSLLRLLQFRLEACGEVGWWFRPPWNKKKDRPSVLDAERLMRRHRGRIQRFL